MKNKLMNPDFMLIMVAVIWGTGFIAVEYAINSGMSPLLILTSRFTVAAIVLLVILFKKLKTITKSQWHKGSIAGIILFLGFYLQTTGQGFTEVSNSAFITTTNVIMVPFVVWVISKKKPKLKMILLALMTFVGITILTVNFKGGLHFNVGDILILLCAVAFACHIAYTEVAVAGNDPLIITFVQILVASILSLVGLIIFDLDALSMVNYELGIPAVIFLGVFSTCLCFFMQSSAQKRTSAAKAGIIMSTEGFFGTLFAILLGIEPLTAKVILGGTIILTAVILTEVRLDFRKVANVES